MSARGEAVSSSEPFVDFLRSNSPAITLPELEALPIFPREQRPGRRGDIPDLGRVSFAKSLVETNNLPKGWFAPIPVKEEDEDDFANENLVLMDGWRE